jgi:hypothetical protein
LLVLGCYPKELLTIYSEGRVLTLNNFCSLFGYGFPKFKRFKTFFQDKGHQTEFKMFITKIIDGGQPLIPLQEIINVSLASFAVTISAMEKRFVFEQELI